MTSANSSIIDQLINKLGLKDEVNLKEKTTELLRLLEVKSRTSLAISDYAKTIICINLATTLLGITFDYENGIKLAGIRKSVYQNYKRTIEKVLDLNKPVGINEICVQLGLNELVTKATEFLNFYKESVADNANDIDLAHPQYAAMAVYQAIKCSKTKAMKPKLMGYSHLRPSQWNRLEVQWDKLLMSCNKETRKVKQPMREESRLKTEETSSKVSVMKQSKLEEVEDYEVWKARMLALAELELAMQRNGMLDKEN